MKKVLNVLCLVVISFILLFGCSSKNPQPGVSLNTQGSYHSSGTQPYNTTGNSGSYVTGSPASTGDTPFQPGYETYMREQVDNFMVILDASGSKFLPYNGQIKLKIAKDIVRRLNQRTPNRPLVSGLRRYGFEAGAWSVHTSLIYGVTNYSRSDFANAIEIVKWAGGKSPLALSIDKASDDMQSMVGNMALIIVSDGKIYEGDPLEAARRIKDRYGDRLCIYTAQVGNLPFGWKILEQIAKIGGCGYATTSDCLQDDKNMSDWVDDIFSRGHKMTCRPPKIEEVIAKPPVTPIPRPMDICPDEDGDGVCDQDDRCPGTPRGARVDEYGCWIIGVVQFDLDRYNIKPEYYSVIDEVVRVMKLNPELKMKIEGHTCIIASEQYNMKLSHNRAIAVVDYMLKQGIASERISVEGFAFHKPTSSNRSREGRIKNRRAEFIPVKPIR